MDAVILYAHRDFYSNSNIFLPILLIGIILTGSRAIYILTAIMLIYVMKNNPQYIKKILIFVTTLILIVALINILKIDIKVLKRLTQFSFHQVLYLEEYFITKMVSKFYYHTL